jgi:transcriptional regulator with XRE-family HTH domain
VRSEPPTPRVLQRRREIGAHIRDARTRRHLSQERLGELVGLSRQSIYRIELGERAARVDWLILIADALDVTLADLVRDVDPPEWPTSPDDAAGPVSRRT